MLTRRTFHIVMLSLGTITTFSSGAGGQQDGMVTIRIRADDSVRAIIPPIAQRNLTIEPDQSEAAQDLARRSPPQKAVPVIFIIIGAMALTQESVFLFTKPSGKSAYFLCPAAQR
jgi:hypothetical protein